MKKRISASDIASLNVTERIQFVEDLGDSIADLPNKVKLTADVKTELDKRLAVFHKNTREGSQWKAVKKRILSKA